jgi:hypothetical protein
MRNVTLDGTNAVADLYDQNSPKTPEFRHLHAEVDPDGSSAIISIYTAEGQLDLSITIDQMASALSEIGAAGSVMMHRQLKARDKGQSAFEAMMRSAPMAASVTPSFDRPTGDAVIVFRFQDRMPISVRMSHEQFLTARAAFSSELKRSSN